METHRQVSCYLHNISSCAKLRGQILLDCLPYIVLFTFICESVFDGGNTRDIFSGQVVFIFLSSICKYHATLVHIVMRVFDKNFRVDLTFGGNEEGGL